MQEIPRDSLDDADMYVGRHRGASLRRLRAVGLRIGGFLFSRTSISSTVFSHPGRRLRATPMCGRVSPHGTWIAEV
ncbi:hypothetical protein BKA56DRAFT_568902 [Ilyonectria sp. MPI-CAGE-AT-0026]|nr:hypothetical protein BKA56DRAFT_568902 [Ilyonectria sp. MPI-CAGE-AT-0026]